MPGGVTLTGTVSFRTIVPEGSADGFEAMRAAILPMFRWELSSPEDRSRFTAMVHSTFFDGLSIGGSEAMRSTIVRDNAVVASAGLDDVVVQAYVGADYRCGIEGQIRLIRAGDVLVYDLTRPLAIEAETVSNLSLIIPRGRIRPLVRTLDHAHGLVIRRESRIGRIVFNHLVELKMRAPAFAAETAAEAAAVTTALAGACIGPAPEAQTEIRHALRCGLRSLILARIEQELGNPDLNVDALTQAFGLSRASLYRLFEPLGGVSNYITQRRLARMATLLARTGSENKRILVLANRYGFTNYSAFSRLFRQTFGVAPRDFRASRRKAQEPDGDGHHDLGLSMAAVNDWLRTRAVSESFR